MKLRHRKITAALLIVALAIVLHPNLHVPVTVAAAQQAGSAGRVRKPVVYLEDTIEKRDDEQRGIVVGEPKVYDDALLQQMLLAAEARLATLQVIDQGQIVSRFGAVTRATQRISSFGLNVQGAPTAGVVTTSRGATGSTIDTQQITGSTGFSQTIGGTAPSTTLTQSAGSTGTLQTTSGLAAQDVVTTTSPFSAPPSTAPAPTTTLPSSGFSVSSSDILNEQLQLAAEINGLRLMLAGDLSSHFIKRGDNTMTKLKTTLGFPITLIPDERFKDAVAVVEVEVERAGQSLSTEPPSVTALLPREKTYNVAEITDNSTSIGGGIATQIVGVSGSWFRGHKTYYLVQDQDTVALSLRPESSNNVSFMWEFRPVLGRRYVKGGLKQTFVQLAFPAPADAREGEIGKVRVRTYWRKYDRKRGIHKEVLSNSVSVRDLHFEIPRYTLAVTPPVFNPLQSLEDLGDGKMLVKLKGRFLPGTYVRIGSKMLAGLPQFMHEHFGIRFVAPISDLATKKVFLVSHDGTEVPLVFAETLCGQERITDAAGTVVGAVSTRFKIVGTPRVMTLNETDSLLSLDFTMEKTTVKGSSPATVEDVAPPPGVDIPGLVLSIGSRVFGYSDAPLERVGNTLSAIVPSALLAANPDFTLQLLFPQKQCRTPVSLAAFDQPSQSERLVVLEQGGPTIKLLLYGTRLNGLKVLEPLLTKPPDPIGAPGDADKLLLIELTSAQLDSHKHLLVQRPGTGERPFLITLPELTPKKPDPPKASERVTVGSDEAMIVGDGMKELESVTFRDKPVDFTVVDDKSIRLNGLSALGATSAAATQTFTLQFKSGAKPKVTLEVVNTKLETVTK